MPSTHFTPGDPCYLKIKLCNPGPDTYDNVPVFVILDVYGAMYCAPTWSGFDYFEFDLNVGLEEITVLPEFSWPSGVGAADGLMFYAAMTDPDITYVLGSMDTFTFSWGA